MIYFSEKQIIQDIYMNYGHIKIIAQVLSKHWQKMS